MAAPWTAKRRCTLAGMADHEPRLRRPGGRGSRERIAEDVAGAPPELVADEQPSHEGSARRDEREESLLGLAAGREGVDLKPFLDAAPALMAEVVADEERHFWRAPNSRR